MKKKKTFGCRWSSVAELVPFAGAVRERLAERKRERETETERETDRQTDRQRDRDGRRAKTVIE
jgi:hypothetical protein